MDTHMGFNTFQARSQDFQEGVTCVSDANVCMCSQQYFLRYQCHFNLITCSTI